MLVFIRAFNIDTAGEGICDTNLVDMNTLALYILWLSASFDRKTFSGSNFSQLNPFILLPTYGCCFLSFFAPNIYLGFQLQSIILLRNKHIDFVFKSSTHYFKLKFKLQ